MSEKLSGKSSIKILVYGWYHQGNIGDDLFIEAFHYLFSELDLVFTDTITVEGLQNVDAVFFGGGSFLLGHPRIADNALALLKSKKIFYLGVGVEEHIHPLHEELMGLAQLIAIRSPEKLERVKTINCNTRVIPDLAYSLQNLVANNTKQSKSVLIIPNQVLLPRASDPQWKHAAWSYFKSQFCQFMDWLVENDFKIKLFSMCSGVQENDEWAAAELISYMDLRSTQYHLNRQPQTFHELTEFVSEYEYVITQRFHGIVLAEMLRTPYIAIHHHDKLKFAAPSSGAFLSYYNCSKQTLIDNFLQVSTMNYSSVLPIEPNIFEALKEDVIKLL